MNDPQKNLNELWESHLASEFAHKDAEEALRTMTDNPSVVIVPLKIGGRGTGQLRTFYTHHFLNQLPPDIAVTPVKRVFAPEVPPGLGNGTIVDEMVLKFTHSMRMNWILPNIAPTGKLIELPMIVIVTVVGGKISNEDIYWDMGSVLLQAGLLTQTGLPILGAETAHNVLSPEPLDGLITDF